MLILPLHKPLARDNFPFATAVIIALNVLVYFGLQSADRAIEAEAVTYYHESGLAAREWDWFTDHVGPFEQPHRQRIEQIEALEALEPPEGALAGARASIVRAHPDFLDAARAGNFAARESAVWREWRDRRDRYERIRARSFTERHMLSLDAPDPSGLVTHMFLHGGIAHLLGNMLFLGLLGLLVEGALGRGLFVAAYIVSGLAAAGAFIAMHWGATTGMLGASGAIAGLMGLYAVLYGRRRVRFFYWAFVYFDYVRAPALVLLPVWAGWELMQLAGDRYGRIAYEAHLGGIAAGAILALGIRALGLQNNRFLDEDSDRDADRNALTRARAAISRLKPDQAKLKLRPLLDRHPGDTDVLGAWYAACKLRPNDPDRAGATRALLTLEGDTPAVRALVLKALHDSREPPRVRLDPMLAGELAGRLVRWERPHEARRLLDALLRLPNPPASTAKCCEALARLLRHQGESAAADRYLAGAVRTARHTSQERIAAERSAG